MTAPVTFNSFIQGVVADLVTQLAPFNVKDVQSHFGSFDQEALKRFGANAPAARVAVLGVSGIEPYQGVLHVNLRIAIYVVTRDTLNTTTNPPTKVPRDVGMLGIVQAVIQRANANGWSQGAGDQPVNIGAENLYSDDQAGQGVLLWAVSLTQGVNCDVTDITQLSNFAILTDTIEDPADADVVVIADTGAP